MRYQIKNGEEIMVQSQYLRPCALVLSDYSGTGVDQIEYDFNKDGFYDHRGIIITYIKGKLK